MKAITNTRVTERQRAPQSGAAERKAQTEEHERHFANGLNFYKLFWIFFVGCFLGVVIETVWCLLTRHHFESRRGLVYGPFNLVYGFGAVLMTLGLYKLRHKRDAWIFIGGALIGAGFEYVCSFVQELLFGTVSWNYTDMPFNLNGRINLLYSLFWGALAMAWVKGIYPFFSKMIEKIPNRFGKAITIALTVFMLLNTVISAVALDRMAQRRNGISPPNAFYALIDRRFPDERLQRIYSNMQITQGDAPET